MSSRMAARTRSTFPSTTSSSSLGSPEKRMGAPKWSRNFTGSGRKPAGPRKGKVRVMGKAGAPISRPRARMFISPGDCSSLPTMPTGTMGVSVSRARRMKPSPKRCSR